MPSKRIIHPWLQPIKKITDPLKRIIKREAKRIYIPGFQDVNLYQVVTFFIKQLNTLGLYDRAAAISFNFSIQKRSPSLKLENYNDEFI